MGKRVENVKLERIEGIEWHCGNWQCLADLKPRFRVWGVEGLEGLAAEEIY